MTPDSFDEIIHAPHRLRVMAALTSVNGELEFQALRDILDVTPAVVSKHLRVLADAGYLTLHKPIGRGRVRTWVQATPLGREAYGKHVNALRAIVDGGVPRE